VSNIVRLEKSDSKDLPTIVLPAHLIMELEGRKKETAINKLFDMRGCRLWSKPLVHIKFSKA
jgi:hypothetical protein